MARNRKHQAAAVHFGPLVRVVILCLFFGGSAVGYVWQKNQIHELGQRMKKQEGRLAELREANRRMSKQILTMRSPGNLARRIQELNLGLTQPAQSQILRLVEKPLVESDLVPATMYAGQQMPPGLLR